MEEVKENIKPSKFKKFLKIFLVLFILLGVTFYLYIRYLEPSIIKINEQAIIDSRLPEEFNGLKIVHFSDIHYGNTINDKGIDKIVKKINKLSPDVIVYTGDLLNDSINLKDDNFKSLEKGLKKLKSSLKKYAVIGDADYINKDKYVEIMSNAGFVVLENQNDLLFYKSNNPIEFIGTSSMLENELDIDKAITTETNDTEYFKIWLNHEPAIIDDIINKDLRPNILLTGHTLGGLINIPFNGYLLKQDGIDKYTDSYYHKKKISMYVSNGLGTYKYNVRFMNTPSINLYRLYNE